MKNIRKISLMIMLLTLYKVDELLGSSAGADTVQTIEQRELTEDEKNLFSAVKFGNEELFENLYKKVADLNVQDIYGYTLLMEACRENHLIIAQMLLEAGVNPNVQDVHGQTAIMKVSSDWRADEIVKKLLAAGANPNNLDLHGFTPLAHACNKRSLSILERLLAAGANPKIQTNFRGPSCLMLAIERPIMVRTLLDAGANVNVPENNGFVPLMLACRNNDEDVVKMLLAAGADLKIRNNRGETALDYCQSIPLYLLVLKSMLVRGSIQFTKDYYKNNLDPMSKSRQMTMSSQKSLSQIFNVFDALNVDLEEKMLCLRDEPKADIQEFKSAYESFINGEHDLLRDVLLRRYVAYDLLSKKSGTYGFKEMKDSVKSTIIFCVKKESIRPLLGFLCRTKQERAVVDAMFSDIIETIEAERRWDKRGMKRER